MSSSSSSLSSSTLSTPRYVRTPLPIPNQSVYLPCVPRRLTTAPDLLDDIFAEVGVIDSIDWCLADDGRHRGRSAYIHFSMCFDTATSEQMLCAFDQDLSYRLPMVLEERERYLILRKAHNILPRYKGPYSIDYFAEAIDIMSQTAAAAGGMDILKPKHIRFDDDGVATVCDYYVSLSTLPNNKTKYTGNKNIHQLAAEYNGWMNYLKNTHKDSSYSS